MLAYAAGVLRQLETVVPPATGRPEPLIDHPMRTVTRQAAFEPDGWTKERAAKVAELFDGLAPEWHTRRGPESALPLVDALDRGGPFPSGPTLEAGSGVGAFTAEIAARLDDVIACDLSYEMLRRAPGSSAPRCQADASALPFADGTFGVVVLVNMLLFPREMVRVLRRDGTLVWVNTVGDATPIHLAAADVLAALPGEWHGVHAEAGWGTWAVLHRQP